MLHINHGNGMIDPQNDGGIRVCNCISCARTVKHVSMEWPGLGLQRALIRLHNHVVCVWCACCCYEE